MAAPEDSVPDHWQTVKDVAELLAHFTLPLYADDERGVPEQLGTGFIIRAFGRHFLVSAAHVLSIHADRPLFYYWSPSETRRLDGYMVLDRTRDVGFVALAHQTPVLHPSTEKIAVEITRVQPRLLPRSAYSYAVVGFPSTKNETDRRTRTVDASAFVWIAEGCETENHSRDVARDPDALVITFNRRRAFRDENTQITFPKPNGMSGGPIFALFHNEDSRPLDDFRVVAVATTHFIAEKQMMGTDIRVPLAMIGDFLANVDANRNMLRAAPRSPFRPRWLVN